MKEAGIEDPNDIEEVRALGVIDLPTIQKKLNLHYTLSLDLFGSEVSTNAANCYNCGPQGPLPGDADRRRPPARRTRPIRCCKLVDGEIKLVDEPALTAHQHAAARRLHRRLRQGHRALEQDHRAAPASTSGSALPHVAFHRHIGEFKNVQATPTGELIDDGDVGEAEGQVAAVDRPTATSSPA